MTFLTKLITALSGPVLNWIWDRVALLIEQWNAKHKDEKKNEEARKKLEEADTKEKRDESAEEIINKF